MSRADRLIQAARRLSRQVDALRFGKPVTHVYNPLDYAGRGYRRYLRLFAEGRKRVVFLGMNPGPFGMAQTGVPFGEVASVRDWMGIEERVETPALEHPSRPIQGFACRRNEVSGARLWGTVARHFGEPERFFRDHFVANYCPLVFMEASGRNRTPDKLAPGERQPLYAACDDHLRRLVEALEPEWVIGIGAFAEERAREALGDRGVRLGRILHPSPASPLANRDWAGTALRELRALGVCARTASQNQAHRSAVKTAPIAPSALCSAPARRPPVEPERPPQPRSRDEGVPRCPAPSRIRSATDQPSGPPRRDAGISAGIAPCAPASQPCSSRS